MKISELSKKNSVPKETIHYYIREGLLPKPRKVGRNLADYTEDYIDRIKMVRELQDNYYLPLSVIKQIIKKQKKSALTPVLTRIRSEYFRPIDKLLPARITGEKSFLEKTGMDASQLYSLEKAGLIIPELENGKKTYSQDDEIVAKTAQDINELLEPHGDEEARDILISFHHMVSAIVRTFTDEILSRTAGEMDKKELAGKIAQTREIAALFFYHLFLNLSKQAFVLKMDKSPESSLHPPRVNGDSDLRVQLQAD